MATSRKTARLCFFVATLIATSVQIASAFPPPSGADPPMSGADPVVALELLPVSESEPFVPPVVPPDVPPFESGAEAAPTDSAEETSRPDSEASSTSDPAESSKEKADPDAPPGIVSPKNDVKKNGPGESVIVESEDDRLGKRIDDLFRINENSMSWVLRSGDTDGIGFFSWETTPAWDFNMDGQEGFDVEFLTGIHWVDGPGRTDLPARLFDLSWHVRVWDPDFIEVTGQPPIGLEADFDIGLHTDFEDSARKGWRFPGRLLFMQESSPGFWWTAGFEYLDLDHIQMLPAGGFILKPENTQLNLYFPRPKLRVRTAQKERQNDWLYIEGEYRGRAWAIERSTTGLADVATLSEYRLGVGWETEPTRRDKDDEGSSNPQISFFDVSWLFGRDLEYRSGAGNYQPHDTVMFRVGSRY